MSGLLQTEKKEKKVEYVELIYDLIFVYIIGRNNLLLHSFADGFVERGAFFAYLLTTLAVIQIWNYTTYYVNIYGRHGIRDHVFLFVNMFLLYFIAQGTRTDWQGYHTQYHIAWALILANVGTQYLFEFGNRKSAPEAKRQMIKMASILFIQAVFVALCCFEQRLFGSSLPSLFAILFGMVAVFTFGQRKSGSFVDFPHLSERAMLYVVFTFGEMIIGVAGYFDDVFSFSTFYFALMAFLIVVALFLSYGYFYDHLINREKKTNGLLYMFLHIFLIFSLNNITNALEFMREDEIALLPKMLFLVASFFLYFSMLFVVGASHARSYCKPGKAFVLSAIAFAAVFALVMFVFRNNMYVNIALTVLFVYTVFVFIYAFGRKTEKKDRSVIERS